MNIINTTHSRPRQASWARGCSIYLVSSSLVEVVEVKVEVVVVVVVEVVVVVVVVVVVGSMIMTIMIIRPAGRAAAARTCRQP